MSVSSRIDLDAYIVNDYIRGLFEDTYCWVDDQSTIKEYVRMALESNKDMRLIFSKTFLKNIFFDQIKYYTNDLVSIINCNSNRNLFETELALSRKLIIYNNVNKIDDDEIVNLIKEYNGILVC